MPSKKKDSRTVCVVTVFYKRQYLGSLVFDSPETGEAITSAVQTMLGPSGEQDVSFETTLQPLYDTETIERELQEIIKSLIPSVPSTPTVDLGKLLTEERALNGLSERIDLSQIMGLWQLGDSYRYDSELFPCCRRTSEPDSARTERRRNTKRNSIPAAIPTVMTRSAGR